MTDTQHGELLTELRAIRAVLESKPRAATPATVTAPSASSLTSLPTPDYVVENAGAVQIHFGKNTGTPISALSDKQLLWYGADRASALKNDGTPFPAREADVVLKNACRTVWQQRVSGAPIVLTSQPSDEGENLPF